MKLNAKMVAGLLLILFGMALMLILSLPSAKSKRQTAMLKEMAKASTTTDEATWKLADSCTGFQQVSGKKFGDGIVFMPTDRANIAELADSFRSNIIDANIKIVPLPDKNSPISEKFLKLCLHNKWSSNNSIQQAIANGPETNKAKIEQMWNDIPSDVRIKIDAQLAENQQIYEKLGKFGGFFSYKGTYTKSTEFVGVIMCSRAARSY